MIESIVALRFLATCLITNSHLGNVWPLSELATGGALGNGLFFFVSGYCVSTKNKKFFAWMGKKIERLYVPILIVQLFLYAVGIYKSNSMIQIFKMFIFPTNYWFFPAILIGFCVMYFYDNAKPEKRILLSVLCLSVMIIRYYVFRISKIGVENDFIVKTSFYILIMQLGYMLRRKKYLIGNENSVNAILTVFGVVGMYGWKILEMRSAFFYNFQLGEYVFLTCFVWGIFSICINHEKWFQGLISHRGWNFVRWIAARSWVIYLVQVPLVHHLKLLNFPFSLFEMIAMIILCAFCLDIIFRYVTKYAKGVCG